MTRVATAVGAVLLAITLAGCSDGGGGPTQSWADSVCSSIEEGLTRLTSKPDIDQSSPQAAKESLVRYLGTLETALDDLGAGVADAGTPPVDGGEEAVSAFTGMVGKARHQLTSARSRLDAAPVDDPAAFQRAFRSAAADLRSLSEVDPAGTFSANAELGAAFKESESCRGLAAATS